LRRGSDASTVSAVVAADSALVLHPDRLLPVGPTERDIARRLYGACMT